MKFRETLAFFGKAGSAQGGGKKGNVGVEGGLSRGKNGGGAGREERTKGRKGLKNRGRSDKTLPAASMTGKRGKELDCDAELAAN